MEETKTTLISRLKSTTGTRQNILAVAVGLPYGEKQGLIFLVMSVWKH